MKYYDLYKEIDILIDELKVSGGQTDLISSIQEAVKYSSTSTEIMLKVKYELEQSKQCEILSLRVKAHINEIIKAISELLK